MAASTPMPMTSPNDDSPFIRPPSPPVRPSLTPFRGDGSVYLYLILGLKVLLIESVDAPRHSDPYPGSSGTPMDDERERRGGIHHLRCHSIRAGGQRRRTTEMYVTTLLSYYPANNIPVAGRLSSSIHAIYRPLARSRRMSTSMQGNALSESPVIEEGNLSDESSNSEDESNADFELHHQANSPVPTRPQVLQQHQSLPPMTIGDQSILNFRPRPDRGGSLATVRLNRRARLAEKLREVFELDGIHEVWAGMCSSASSLYTTSHHR
jgi:sterol 3beta-glucosyltransferase